MSLPRVRLAWDMVAVAFIALDLASIRAVTSGLRPIAAELIVLGVLPTANVLALGGLVGLRHPKSRPFLLGFGTFEAASLAAFAAWVLVSHHSASDFLGRFFRPVEAVSRAWPPLIGFPFIALFAGACMLLPHLLVAWAGGRLSRTFKIVVVRREAAEGGRIDGRPAGELVSLVKGA